MIELVEFRGHWFERRSIDAVEARTSDYVPNRVVVWLRGGGMVELRPERLAERVVDTTSRSGWREYETVAELALAFVDRMEDATAELRRINRQDE